MKPGDISRGPRETGNNTATDGIEARHHDDGSRPRGPPGRQCRGVSVRHEHVGLELNELDCEVRESFRAAPCRTVLDDEILTLDVSKLSESLSKRVEVSDISVCLENLEHADTVSRPRLLRPGAEWLREKASSHGTDEPSTVHEWRESSRTPRAGLAVR